MIRINLLLLLLVFGMHSFAQTLPGTYKSSWIGNTFGGKNSASGTPNAADPQDKWVQDFINCMTVAEDGTCYTASDWDEAHREYGIYKDGDVLGNMNMHITCGSAGGYSIVGDSIIGNGKTIRDAGQPTALAMGRGTYDGKLLVADNGQRKQVLVYDVSAEPIIIETIGVEGGIVSDFTPAYAFPAAVNAPEYPVKNYPPGYYHPLKLWGLTGVGCDILGRIFVSTSEAGSAIRCFKKDAGNWILDWRVENYFFVDNVWYDEKTDAAEIYGIQEHIRLDFSKSAAGQEWSIIGYTLDSYNYPEDPRGVWQVKGGHEHRLTAAVEREINGTRYIWSQGMTCQPPIIFKFLANTDIAVPCAMFFQRNNRIYDLPIDFWWPPQRLSTDQGGTMFWSDLNNDGKYTSNEYSMLKNNFDGGDYFIDNSGNLWQGRNPVKIWKPTIEPNGNIVYSDDNIEKNQILGISSIGKLKYQEDYDRLVVLSASCNLVDGGEMYIIDNWSKGNRKARYIADITGTNMTAWAVAGDYAFHGGQYTNAKVFVTDLISGQMIGSMQPDASCGGLGRTGWIDISSGIQAYKRTTTGEYLVFVEDDLLSRVILYRWCPTGDCTESDMKVSLTNPENGKVYINNTQLQITANVVADSSAVSKVIFFVNDQLIGEDNSSPYESNWINPVIGYAKVNACALSTNGVSSYSSSSIVRVADGTPEVQLYLTRTQYSLADSILLDPKVVTVGSEIDSIIFYASNDIIYTEIDTVYPFLWKDLTAGSWNIRVKAIDKLGRIGWSQTIIVTISAWAVIDDTDLGWTWNGYEFDGCSTCYNGSAHSSDVEGVYGLYTFYGTDLEAYCETFNGGGEIEIYIDDVLKGSFSQSVSPYGGGNIFAKISGLPKTLHVAKFVSASATWTGIDYIKYSANPPIEGTVKGTVSFDTLAVNLSKLGTADWKHFSNNDHKATGDRINSISDYSVISGNVTPFTADLPSLSWTDGTPTLSSTNNTNGLYIDGVGNGFSFLAPAGNRDDTLKVFVGGWNSGGTLTAHIQNGGTRDFIKAIALKSNHWNSIYTIIYNAKEDNNFILISWLQTSGTGFVSMQAATLGKEDLSTSYYTITDKSSIMSLYPNPVVNGLFMLQTDADLSNGIITITNMLGKIIQAEIIVLDNSNAKIEVPSLKSGLYFLSLTVGNKQYFLKFMVI